MLPTRSMARPTSSIRPLIGKRVATEMVDNATEKVDNATETVDVIVDNRPFAS